MKVSFAGAKLKIKRAYKHINELEQWFDALVQANIDAARVHKETHPAEEPTTVMVQRTNEFFREVGPIVGDAVHNLRSALDHAACAIVGTATGSIPNRLYFPMNDTRESLIGSKDYQSIEVAAPEFARVISDVIKPYKAANYQLWALNQLDRMDKHRILVPSVTHSTHIVVAIREEDEDNPPPIGAGAIYSIGEGTPDNPKRLRPGSAAFLHNQNNGYPAVEIRFGKGGVFDNQPIISTLHQVAELVRDAVEALEACSIAAGN